MSAPAADPQATHAPLSHRERFTIAMMCMVNIINYMDRFCVAGVLVKIQEYYDVGDDLGGLLQSGFLIAYMLSSPVFGYLGDRYSRRFLIIFCIILWSAMTLSGSFASKYPVFFVFRTLVGAGEAGFTTIAPTVLSDLVSAGKRSTVLALFYLAIPVGSGLGYLVSAKIEQLTGYWWWGLRATPALGGLCAILLCFAVDPGRGEKEAAAVGGKPVETTSYKQDLVYLLKNASFMLSTAAFTCVSFLSGALSWWGPKCLYYGFKLIPDNADVQLGDVMFTFGLVTVLTGVFGVVCGSLCSKLLRPKIPWVDPVICGIGLLLSAPLLVAALYAAAKKQLTTFILIFFGQFTLNLNWAVVADILLYVVIPTRRSSGAAVQMLISHSLGDCCSPFIVGVLSEQFKHHHTFDGSSGDPNSDSQIYHALKLSILLTMIVEVLGGIFFLINSCFVVHDQEEAKRLAVNTS